MRESSSDEVLFSWKDSPRILALPEYEGNVLPPFDRLRASGFILKSLRFSVRAELVEA
jgi:hypothetical protein